MVLVDAVFDLTIPDPTACKLVTIPAFVHLNVAGQEPKGLRLAGGDSNTRHLAQIQPSTLNVCHAKIRNLQEGRIRLSLGVLGNSADDICDVAEAAPRPPHREVRQL